MFEAIAWIGTFIIVYISYEIFVIRKERALAIMKTSKELDIIKTKYKLDYNKLDMRKVVRMVGFSNAIMISTLVTIVSIVRTYLDNLLLWSLSIFAVGIIFLLPMLLIRNKIIGERLRKQQGGKK